MQLLFFLSPVIYPVEQIPEEWKGIPVRAIMSANPIAEFISAFRNVLYDLTWPDLGQFAAMAGWTAAMVLLAWWVYLRKGQDIGEGHMSRRPGRRHRRHAPPAGGRGRDQGAGAVQAFPAQPRAPDGALRSASCAASPRSPREFWALRDATFDVPKGSMFGIIGHNGSGKSTALKVIAGIYRPTSGSVRVTGKLSALLELGAGFHPELTGRENIVLNASILGMTKQQIAESMEDIIEFAGLGRFIDSPIKTYSSGMYVRLGFAVAVKVNPEILVIDEVIAVGDEDFQRKCFDYIHELRQRGSTIVIVTHSMGIVTDRCDYAMWLDHGEVQAIGDARSVVDAYMHKVNSDEAERGGQEAAEGAEGAEVVVQRGSGDVRIVGVELFGPTGESSVFLINGKPGTMRLHFEAKEATKNVIFGFGFFPKLPSTSPDRTRGCRGCRGEAGHRLRRFLHARGAAGVGNVCDVGGDHGPGLVPGLPGPASSRFGCGPDPPTSLG